MPLSVEIKVNGRLIDIIHVARIRGNTQPDSINEYVALRASELPGASKNPHVYKPVLPEPQSEQEWMEHGMKFKHRYGDGLEACAQKALTTLDTAVTAGD